MVDVRTISGRLSRDDGATPLSTPKNVIGIPFIGKSYNKQWRRRKKPPFFYKENKLIVVYVCDANYLGYVEKSVASLKRIHPNAMVVVVSPEKLDTELENIVIPLDRDYKHNENDRITSATYLKLFLPELPFDKIIYLDGDTLIQKPLDELWQMDCPFINLCETFSKKHAVDMGVKQYGLSGMMVMNLKALREADFTNKCLNAKPTGKIWQHEETLINAAFNDKLNFVDVKWNYCHNRDYGDKSIDENDAHILHICGKNKAKMGYKPYEEIKDVLKLINGKSMAIVGNAQSIFDKANGQAIDDHDIVIRFNKGFITKPEAQGSKTTIFMVACELTIDEKKSYNAFISINRSRNTRCGDVTIKNEMRQRLKNWIGKQPSSGFMAIDICRTAKAKQIDLYGFDFNHSKTFYNPDDYQTWHDYPTEEKIVTEMAKNGILTIN